jgi:RNA recognition motif-containing protein
MNIYVGNLSFDSSEADIENAFGEFGEVKSVNIIKDRDTGRSRGFCFVEMASAEAGASAIEAMDQKDMGGRSLTVNEAKPREQRSGGGGGGGNRW